MTHHWVEIWLNDLIFSEFREWSLFEGYVATSGLGSFLTVAMDSGNDLHEIEKRIPLFERYNQSQMEGVCQVYRGEIPFYSSNPASPEGVSIP